MARMADVLLLHHALGQTPSFHAFADALRAGGHKVVTPDVYDEQRLVVVEAAFVIVEGILQHQDGVTAVKAERLSALQGVPVTIESHDFH